MLDRSPLSTDHIALLDYWTGLEAGGRIPSRAAVNPIELPRLLKSIGLIDAVPEIGGTFRFRYRLVGTRINHIHGSDFTDRWVHEERSGVHGELVEQLYLDAASRRAPQFSRIRMKYVDNRELEIDRLVMPLASDGENVDMLLFSNIFRSENLTFGLKPFRIEDVANVEESLRIAA